MLLQLYLKADKQVGTQNRDVSKELVLVKGLVSAWNPQDQFPSTKEIYLTQTDRGQEIRDKDRGYGKGTREKGLRCLSQKQNEGLPLLRQEMDMAHT